MSSFTYLIACGTLMTALLNSSHAWQSSTVNDINALTKSLEGFGHITKHKESSELGVTIAGTLNTNLMTSPKVAREMVTSLNIESHVDDAGVDGLFDSFVHVKRLTVKPRCWNSQIAIRASQLDGLEELWVHDCDIPESDLSRIGRMKALQVLMLCGNRQLGASIDKLSALTTLRQLCLSDIGRIEPKKLEWIRNNQSLTTLWINGRSVTDDIVPILRRLPKLAILSVIDTSISADGLKQLEAMESMELLFSE